jgi:hypothetical protein
LSLSEFFFSARTVKINSIPREFPTRGEETNSAERVGLGRCLVNRIDRVDARSLLTALNINILFIKRVRKILSKEKKNEGLSFNFVYIKFFSFSRKKG